MEVRVTEKQAQIHFLWNKKPHNDYKSHNENFIDFISVVHMNITEFLLWKWEQFFSCMRE